MRKAEILEKLNELEINLQPDCCINHITPLLKRSKSNVLPQIKLYKDKIDAQTESNNFEWHLLDEILDLNCQQTRNSGINCHQTEQGCIMSLIVRKYENEHNSRTTMFSKINKLEIIYI